MTTQFIQNHIHTILAPLNYDVQPSNIERVLLYVVGVGWFCSAA